MKIRSALPLFNSFIKFEDLMPPAVIFIYSAFRKADSCQVVTLTTDESTGMQLLSLFSVDRSLMLLCLIYWFRWTSNHESDFSRPTDWQRAGYNCVVTSTCRPILRLPPVTITASTWVGTGQWALYDVIRTSWGFDDLQLQTEVGASKWR